MKKVLLLGNGIVRNQNKSWTDIVSGLTLIDSKMVDELPNSIVSILINKKHPHKADEEFWKEISNNQKVIIENKQLKEMVEMSFDAIVTTNYTYEIEKTLNDSFDYLKDKNTIEVGNEKNKKRYLLETHNIVDGKSVYHMHGELRKKMSLIYDIKHYCKLIERIIKQENIINKNKIKKDDNYSTWVEYVLYSDLYIVGQGLDYSEYDLWYLLSERFSHGNINCVHYYEPKTIDNKSKLYLLNKLGVDVKTLDTNIINCGEKEIDIEYKNFYEKVIKDIKKIF